MDHPPGPGFTFLPHDHQLITKFLRPKIAGAGIRERFIHDANVYAAAPEELVQNLDHAPGTDKGDGKGGTWYFFCPVRRKQSKRGGSTCRRRQRTVVGDQGCRWHSEGGAKPVLDEAGRRVGYLRKLSYGTKKSPGAARTITRLGWCMTEFGLDDHRQDDAGDGWVLCKVYRSPQAKKTSTSTATSAAGSKRKADDEEHPEAPRPRNARQETTTDTVSQYRLLQEMERWLLSDDDEPICMSVDGGVDIGSVDPAGFFSDILDVEGWLLQGRRAEEATEEDHGRFECTLDELLGVPAGAGELYMPSPAPPAFVSCGSQSLHVAAECATANCNLCIAQMMEYLAS